MLNVPVISFFYFCGCVGFKDLVNNPMIIFNGATLIIPIAVCCFTLQLNLVLKVNNEFVEEIYEKLKSKEEYRFILDKLEHSIIIIKDNQIEFVNDRFLH